jgi:hypothetical protein
MCAAHNEALKKEVQRLRQHLQQQQQHHQMQQQQMQHQHQHQHQLQSATPTAYEVQQQQFSKLDINESKHVAANGVSAGIISSHRGNGRQMVMKGPLGSTGCMAPGMSKGMDGRLVSGHGSLHSDYMVHNP